MRKLNQPQRYLFKFFYISTEKFHGSQRQENYSTIESCLLDALIKKNYIKDAQSSGFEASSRTDRFVSARGAAFSFISLKEPILMEINSILPKEIGLWAYSAVGINFSSRFNAIYRHYRYILPQPIKFIEKNSTLNFELMNKACKELESSHDFINFAKRDKNVIKTIRNILSANITLNDDYIIFDFKSKAFLRQQIRRMVKKILELGKGEIAFSDFLALFDTSKHISYQPADPSGLLLWDIKFDDEIKFTVDLKSKEKMKNYFLNQKLNFGHKFQLFKILQHSDFS